VRNAVQVHAAPTRSTNPKRINSGLLHFKRTNKTVPLKKIRRAYRVARKKLRSSWRTLYKKYIPKIAVKRPTMCIHISVVGGKPRSGSTILGMKMKDRPASKRYIPKAVMERVRFDIISPFHGSGAITTRSRPFSFAA
jgi:hypothetical protein